MTGTLLIASYPGSHFMLMQNHELSVITTKLGSQTEMGPGMAPRGTWSQSLLLSHWISDKILGLLYGRNAHCTWNSCLWRTCRTTKLLIRYTHRHTSTHLHVYTYHPYHLYDISRKILKAEKDNWFHSKTPWYANKLNNNNFLLRINLVNNCYLSILTILSVIRLDPIVRKSP